MFGIVVVLALALRTAHIRSVLESPIGGTLVGDSRYYHQEALRTLGALESDRREGPSFMGVGYPHVLAAIYAFLGASLPAVLWIQAASGVLTAALLSLAAWLLFGGRLVALLAGAFYAAYAVAMFYEGTLLTPSFTNLLVAAALVAVADHLRTGRVLSAVAAGIAASFAVWLRVNLLLWIPALALVVLIGRATTRRRLAAASWLVAAATALPLSVIAYHGVVHRAWVPVSAGGGMNFWVGNNANAEGVYYGAGFAETQSPDEEERAFLEEARRRTGDAALTLTGSSGYWFRQGLREIGENPWRWLGLELKKLALFWNRYETKTNLSLEFVQDFSPVLSRFSAGFALLATLGLGGLVHLLVNRRGPAAWLVISVVLAPMATCVLFFVSGEYRHAASPGLCLSAAVFLEGCVRFRSERSRLVYPWAAIVLALPLVLWHHGKIERAGDPLMDYWNCAVALSHPHADGTPPSREDFRKAAELLDHARLRNGEHLILDDGWLWVHYRAAMEFRDVSEASLALQTAASITARLAAAPDLDGFYPRFLRASLRSRIADLSRQDFIRARPELAADAAILLESEPGSIRLEPR